MSGKEIVWSQMQYHSTIRLLSTIQITDQSVIHIPSVANNFAWISKWWRDKYAA